MIARILRAALLTLAAVALSGCSGGGGEAADECGAGDRCPCSSNFDCFGFAGETCNVALGVCMPRGGGGDTGVDAADAGDPDTSDDDTGDATEDTGEPEDTAPEDVSPVDAASDDTDATPIDVEEDTGPPPCRPDPFEDPIPLTDDTPRGARHVSRCESSVLSTACGSDVDWVRFDVPPRTTATLTIESEQTLDVIAYDSLVDAGTSENGQTVARSEGAYAIEREARRARAYIFVSVQLSNPEGAGPSGGEYSACLETVERPRCGDATVEATCDDGIDDDCDGDVDCADEDCFEARVCRSETACGDEIDDDRDGDVDCEDRDCRDDELCVVVEEICDNDEDDNENLLVDCDDPQCIGDDACAPLVENCTNGDDDDLDELTDCDDPDCDEESACIEEICDNGIDDDGDRRTDCDDTECEDADACIVLVEFCANEIDDDEDGLVDCDDPDCDDDDACFVPPEVCTGGLDEDEDGRIDCDDPDCAGDPACIVPDEICDNEEDDDRDGEIDCDDPDCAAFEACSIRGEECENGVDDDTDGFADCEDPDCEDFVTCDPIDELCGNALDDDGDGLVDCDDPECGLLDRCGLLTGVVKADGGASFSCAVASSGRVYCWGKSTNGRLGTPAADAGGDREVVPAPVAVPGITTATAVSVGATHACAVLTDRTAMCWGGNDRAQLGNGATTEPSVPVAVEGLTGIADISAGGAHTCARTATGDVYCWGTNGEGQVGTGSVDAIAPVREPTLVEGLDFVRQISAGGQHTCALQIDGSLYCWGFDSDGQIGSPDAVVRTVSPAPVSSLARVRAVAAGARHTCAIDSAGLAWCWGRNTNGQLGDGTVSARVDPVRVRNLDRVDAIAAGGDLSCALRPSGRIACWGRGYARVEALPGILDATTVDTGVDHGLAVVGDGLVASWGLNNDGQLGDGLTGDGSFSSIRLALDTGEVCDNGFDEDFDMIVDCDDPDCDGAPACTEQCTGGLDEDEDGRIDCDDEDCADDPACLPDEICDNGADEDDDGQIDCEDADCVDDPACAPVEDCDNGADDDGDTAVDCDDDDCADDPACAGG